MKILEGYSYYYATSMHIVVFFSPKQEEDGIKEIIKR